MKPLGGHFGGKLMFWATRKLSVKKMDAHAKCYSWCTTTEHTEVDCLEAID